MTREECFAALRQIWSVYPPYGQAWTLTADDPLPEVAKEEPMHRQYKGTHNTPKNTGHHFKERALIDLALPDETASSAQQARGWEREARRAERRRSRRIGGR